MADMTLGQVPTAKRRAHESGDLSLSDREHWFRDLIGTRKVNTSNQLHRYSYYCLSLFIYTHIFILRLNSNTCSAWFDSRVKKVEKCVGSVGPVRTVLTAVWTVPTAVGTVLGTVYFMWVSARDGRDGLIRVRFG